MLEWSMFDDDLYFKHYYTRLSVREIYALISGCMINQPSHDAPISLREMAVMLQTPEPISLSKMLLYALDYWRE
jgi:hypothetical protein